MHTEVGGSKDENAEKQESESHCVGKQRDAFSLCKRVWEVESQKNTFACHVKQSDMFDNWKDIVRAARRSDTAGAQPTIRREPQLNVSHILTEESLNNWLTALSKTPNTDADRCNAAQFEILQKVCARILVEHRSRDVNRCDTSTQSSGTNSTEPMLRLVHGGPGVGKSYVINKMRTLFETVCGWTSGWDFQIAALQAVMAEQIGGDTLHHALGLNPFQNDDGDPRVPTKTAEVARRVAQWRWLIIDEVSMLNAALVAEIDMRLRSLVSSVRAMKHDKNGQIRSFGGINVIFIGDFWQLDPPSGIPISAVPADLLERGTNHVPSATTAHGQYIFWGRSAGCVQGVTELTDCVRCHDSWLREVQNEFRTGHLSQTTYKFLHGLPTDVPGSWENNGLKCGNKACRRLLSENKMPTAKKGCTYSTTSVTFAAKNDSRNS